MFAILALLGIGLTVAAFNFFNDDDPDAEMAEVEEYTDGDDQILSADYSDDFDNGLAALVEDGEFSQAEADEWREEIEFPAGVLNISTGAGDDEVVGSEGDDSIDTGADDDVAVGGRGDDLIDLGDGDDISGFDDHSVSLPDDIMVFPIEASDYWNEAEQELGDDTIRGGEGMDAIADGYGSNVLLGNQGSDFLVGVDEDEGAPDTLNGGAGSDWIFADEGDTIHTGGGRDEVTVELIGQDVSEGYEVATITDFNLARDSLVLEGNANPLSLVDLTDDEGAVIGVTVRSNGIDILNVIGGQGMAVSDITVHL